MEDLTMKEIFSLSSNIGMSKIVESLSKTDFYKYLIEILSCVVLLRTIVSHLTFLTQTVSNTLEKFNRDFVDRNDCKKRLDMNIEILCI